MSAAEDPQAKAERELREHVVALGQKFLLRTQGQVVSLRELTAQLRAGEAGAPRQMQEIAHKIHGSGAMFGFARVSECGGDLERLCIGMTPDPDTLQRIAHAIDQLDSAVSHLLPV
jgi:HPt (histidine-containing phosphotransfer) domain-containing protein